MSYNILGWLFIIGNFISKQYVGPNACMYVFKSLSQILLAIKPFCYIKIKKRTTIFPTKCHNMLSSLPYALVIFGSTHRAVSWKNCSFSVLIWLTNFTKSREQLQQNCIKLTFQTFLKSSSESCNRTIFKTVIP